MKGAPFHRRILPWIFTLFFFVSAPALVFYTAGYRWNPKKNKIERNGTLIVDTRPTGARVLLNDRDTQETSPVTLQNVTPGQYRIKLDKEGYFSWEKRLDIYPELVTFANNVRLWKKGDPVLLARIRADRLESSPDNSRLAAVEKSGTEHTSSTIRVLGLSGQELGTYVLPGLSSEFRLKWSEDSRSLLAENQTLAGIRSYYLNARTATEPMELPPGRYRWNGSRLEGTSQSNLISIHVPDGVIAKTPYPPGVEDRLSDYTLRHATGTQNLVLFEENNPKRGLILPSGNWRFESSDGSHLILKDGRDWISINPDEPEPAVKRAKGDYLRSFNNRKTLDNLTIEGGEIWIWNAAHNPELLARESSSVLNVVWHGDGGNIAFAVEGAVYMLNLDPRDGRLRTHLADFEAIRDIALVDGQIFISGKKNGTEGIWKLTIE